MSEAAGFATLLPGLLAVVGALLFLASAIGLSRLPDLYTRVHAPAKAASLGLILLAIASLTHNVGFSFAAALESLLLVGFTFLTAPLSAQLIMRAAAARGVPADPRTVGTPPPRRPPPAADAP